MRQKKKKGLGTCNDKKKKATTVFSSQRALDLIITNIFFQRKHSSRLPLVIKTHLLLCVSVIGTITFPVECFEKNTAILWRMETRARRRSLEDMGLGGTRKGVLV